MTRLLHTEGSARQALAVVRSDTAVAWGGRKVINIILLISTTISLSSLSFSYHEIRKGVSGTKVSVGAGAVRWCLHACA